MGRGTRCPVEPLLSPGGSVRLKRGEPPLQFCDDFQIPLAMTDQISTPPACRVGLAGVVRPCRAFKLRNESPNLIHGSCCLGHCMVRSPSGWRSLE